MFQGDRKAITLCLLAEWGLNAQGLGVGAGVQILTAYTRTPT